MFKLKRLFVYFLTVLVFATVIPEINRFVPKHKVSNLGRVPLPGSFETGRVSFSPNGKTLATISDSRVILWSLKGRTIRTIPYKTSDQNSNYSAYNQFEFSPDGKNIVVISKDEIIFLTLEGQQIWSLPLVKLDDIRSVRQNHSTYDRFEFSPNGKNIAIISRNNLILLAIAGQQIWSIPIENFNRVEFHPDGQSILLSNDKEVKIITLDGKEIANLRNEVIISNLLWSPDGKILATLSAERIITWKRNGEKIGTIELKDSDIPKEIRDLYKGYGNLYKHFSYLYFTSDGKKIWTTSSGRVRIWNLQGELLKNLSDILVEEIIPHRDDPAISTVHSDRVRMWSSDGQLIKESKIQTVQTDWSISNQLLAREIGNRIELLNVENNKRKLVYPALAWWSMLRNLDLETTCQNPEISPDRQTLVSECDFFYYDHGDFPYGLRIWNRKGQEIWAPKKAGYNDYVFSPDGKTIAIRHDDEVTLLDLRRANK